MKKQPGFYASFSTIELELPGGMPVAEPQVIMSPLTASKVGFLLMNWGQMHLALYDYTKCLIAKNGTAKHDPLPKRVEFRRLRARFLDEASAAFAGSPFLLKFANQFCQSIDASGVVRHRLAHDILYSVAYDDEHSGVGVNFVSKTGVIKNQIYRIDDLQQTINDISRCHGRLLQLALSTQLPLPCTLHERSILQAIVDTGYWNHPTPPKTPRQPKPSPA